MRKALSRKLRQGDIALDSEDHGKLKPWEALPEQPLTDLAGELGRKHGFPLPKVMNHLQVYMLSSSPTVPLPPTVLSIAICSCPGTCPQSFHEPDLPLPAFRAKSTSKTHHQGGGEVGLQK
jgi:hypothetical protein